MSEFDATQPPTSFRITSIICIVWMLLGCASYLMHVTMTPESMAALPPAQADLMRATPAWVYAFFAIGTWGGLAGAIALFLRKRMAVLLLLVSLVAILVQFGYVYFGMNALGLLGASSAAFPALIIILGIAFWLYARSADSKGWLR